MITVSRPKRTGRPSKLTEAMKDTVVNHYNCGMTQKEIAEEFKVSVATIRKALAERTI